MLKNIFESEKRSGLCLLTLIALSEDFGQVERMFDRLFPCFRFKGKFYSSISCHGGKLEEVASNDELNSPKRFWLLSKSSGDSLELVK